MAGLRSLHLQVDGMKGGFAEKEVDQGSDVSLDYEEEIFLNRDVDKCRAEDGIGRIGPYPFSN